MSTKFTPSRKTRKFYILNFLNVWNNSIKWLPLKKIYWNGENIISSLFDRSSLPVYVTSYNENSKSFFVNSFSSFICSNVKFSNISLEQIPDFSRTKNMIFYTSYHMIHMPPAQFADLSSGTRLNILVILARCVQHANHDFHSKQNKRCQ